MSDDETPEPVIIPWERLSEEALRGVIEEFVTREGTEYGRHDVELESKVRAVRRQLEKKEIVVVFDGETANLAMAKDVSASK